MLLALCPEPVLKSRPSTQAFGLQNALAEQNKLIWAWVPFSEGHGHIFDHKTGTA